MNAAAQTSRAGRAWRPSTPQFRRWSRRQITVSASLAILAAIVAAVIGFLQPSSYQATAVVFLAPLFPNQTSSNASTAVGDFETAAGLDGVVRRVAATTGADLASVQHGVGLTQVGTSAAVRLTYHAGNRSRTASVVEAVAHQALVTLAQQELDGATDQVTAAQRTVNDLNTQLNALASGVGVNDIVGSYQQVQGKLSVEKGQLAAGALSVAAQANQNQIQLNQLAAVMSESQRLAAQIQQAQATLQGATTSQVEARGAVTAALAPTAVSAALVNPIGRAASILRLAIIAGFVTLVIALALAYLRRRSSSTAPDAPSDPTTDRSP